MWGLLYPLIVGGAKAIKGIQDTIENEEFKQKYRHDDAGTYYDNKMNLHDQKTGHIVRYEKDLKTGDVYVKDCETGKRLRNLTQNAVEAHYQEERQKFLEGKTARTYVQYGKNEHRNDKCIGVRYKDLKTGKLYVMRTIDRYGYDEFFRKIMLYPICTICLMDIETGEFIRPADNALCYTEDYKKEIMYEAIKKENEKKKIALQKEYTHPSTYDFIKYSSDLANSPGMELTDEDNEYLLSKGRRLI